MTIANSLTLIRLIISPIFLLVYVEHNLLGISTTVLPYILLFLLAASELSDAFDGHLARKYNQVTEFGKLFDPMADSISHIAIFLTFTQPPVRLHPLLIFIFLYRDSVISTLRTICALKGFALAARSSGKAKAVVQATAAFLIVLLMIPHSLEQVSSELLHQVSTLIVIFAGAYTIYSGIEYLYANRSYLKKLLFTAKT